MASRADFGDPRRALGPQELEVTVQGTPQALEHEPRKERVFGASPEPRGYEGLRAFKGTLNPGVPGLWARVQGAPRFLVSEPVEGALLLLKGSCQGKVRILQQERGCRELLVGSRCAGVWCAVIGEVHE